MNALELLGECRQQGVRVHRRGAELRWRSREAPSEVLLEKLRLAKAELLEILPDRSKRTIVRFRMRGDAGWATAIAPASTAAAKVKCDLRERHGDRVEFAA